MKDYTIAITTFLERYDLLKNLINQIRSFNQESDIILCINGDVNGQFNEEYRKNILKLCSSHNNIFPIFFIETRGLSKMWNTSIIHSPTDHVLMLNDDLDITTNEFHTICSEISKAHNQLLSSGKDLPVKDLFITINLSFSHFLINKKLFEYIGYFDERFLGFGEEDKDFSFRLQLVTKTNIRNHQISGIKNLDSRIKNPDVFGILGGKAKYTQFNQNFRDQKYKKDPDGVIHRWPHPVKKVLNEIPHYECESFFQKNKHKICKR